MTEKPRFITRRMRTQNDNLAALGEAIRTYRTLHRLRSEDLASKAQVSRGVIHRIEHGDPGVSVGNLLLVCQVLGIDRMLLDGIDPYRTAYIHALVDHELPKRVRR